MRQEKKIDKIEIVGDYKHIQIRQKTIVYDDQDKVIASGNERFVIEPGDWDKAEEFGFMVIAQTFWTDDLLKTYQAKLNQNVQ